MVRAKIGMSIRAAIRAAPTKKLTSSAPHAGVRRSAPWGTSGWSAVRRCQTRQPAATTAPRRYQRPWAANTWTGGRRSRRRGSRRPAPRPAAGRRPGRPRGRCATSRQVDQRPAARSRSAPGREARATIATSPTGVSHRLDPVTGMNSRPHVTSLTSCAGCTNTRQPAPRATSSSRAPGQSKVRRVRGEAPRRARPRAAREPRAGPGDQDGEDQPGHEVDREDHPPVADGQDQRAVQRAEDAAELLHRRRPHRAVHRAGRPGRGRPPAPGWPAPAPRRRRPAGSGRPPGSAGRRPAR